MHSNDDYVVRLEGVSKRYFLNPNRPWGLHDIVADPRTLLREIWPREPFWALREVTLGVRRGEVLGVIGPNGSGKSTLLQILVGISPPTEGSVTIRGRYAALLDLGAGFHPRATGRENAYLNALFMGLPKSEAVAKVPEIIEFSGLERFADQQMRTYSTGMYLRLGFSVAVHVQPEVLLIDEVLAVGDADFREKCYGHFATLRERSTTIVLVTHDVDSLKRFADRVILLEHGRVIRDGEPEEIIDYHLTRQIEKSPAFKRAFVRGMRERGVVGPEGADDADRPRGPGGSLQR